jgi:hypothetical protein
MPDEPQAVDPQAIALEDEDPLAYIGEEAEAPEDTGREPAEDDRDPPEDLTPEEDDEEAYALLEDERLEGQDR